MAILAKITPGLKEDLCTDCDLIVEAAFERYGSKENYFQRIRRDRKTRLYLRFQHIQSFYYRDRKRI